MTNSGKRPIWEQYDDYEEQFIEKGSSGGRERSPHSKTSRAAREASRDNARNNREDEARNRIFSVLRRFPKPDSDPNEFDFLNSYRTWLSDSLHDSSSLLNLQDTEEAFIHSSTKAGGQNLNKVASAVRLTHRPTRIAVRSDSSREQIQNRQLVEESLKKQLEAHVADWKVILGEALRPDPLQIKYFYIASHARPENE